MLTSFTQTLNNPCSESLVGISLSTTNRLVPIKIDALTLIIDPLQDLHIISSVNLI